MFEKIKTWFAKEPEQKPWYQPDNAAPIKDSQPKKREPKKKELSEKERATAAGEPYVSILKVDIDPNNINNGAFELDWNDKFLLNLIRAGYKMKEDDSDSVIVDRWFHTVCRNIVLEMYEQEQADPSNRDPNTGERIIVRNPIGNGRSEIF